MQDHNNLFVINNIWTPSQPSEDVLDTSLSKNLRKPMLEMQSVYNQKQRQQGIVEDSEGSFNQQYTQKTQSYENDNPSSRHQTINRTEESLNSQEILNNYRSVRMNPFLFSPKLQDKKMNSSNSNNYQNNTQQQQQYQSSTYIQNNSNQDNIQSARSNNSYKSNSSNKKNDFSGIGQDFSISFPQLSASQSISSSSIQRGESYSPTKINNMNINGVVKHKKSSFLHRSSMIKQENDKSSSSQDSANSSDSEKRDTLPSQVFTLGIDKKEVQKKEKNPKEDDSSQYDSFTVRMNSINKYKMSSSAPFGNFFQGGEITQIKINKDVFSSASSASAQTQEKNSVFQEGVDENLKQSQAIQQSGFLGNILFSGSGGFVDLIKKLKLKNAVTRMASKTSYRRLQQLSEKHLNFIGDLSIQKQSDEKALKQQQKWYQLLIKHYLIFPTFNPYSIYKMMWDLFMLFVVFFFFIAIPLILSTGDEFEELFGHFPYYIPSIILIIDAFINLNTGYYRNGALVVGKYFVLRNYAKKLLAIDVIGIIPIFLYTVSPSSTLKVFLFLYFIKYKSITKIFKRLELRLDLKSSLLNFIALLKLLFTVLFIAHIFANFWLFLARVNPDQNWLIQAKIKSDKWYDQYMTAYYYITVTMVTVGYGDITPTNNTEVFFAIITILLACGVFAYGVNAIGFILDEINREQKLLNKNMQIINQYLNKKNISRELRFQIREYLEFFWRQQNVGNVELEQKIISQLAHNLKEKLFIEANKLILKDNKVFSNKFSERVLMKTLSIVKEYRYTPQQVIVSRNQQDDSAIYFVESGNVEVFIENEKNHQVQQLQRKGQYFGEISFYTGQERSLSVRSIDFATLLKIEREDFLNLLKMYPRDEETFHQIKDQVLFSNAYGQIGVKCYSCQSPDHLISTCPMVQFVPNKLYCYKRYNYNPGQSRQNFDRIMKEKYSTLKDIDLLKDAAENIQDDYEELMPETDSSISELSCIEDVDEDDEDDDDEEFYKKTPRHRPLLGENRQQFQASLFSYSQQTSPIEKEKDRYGEPSSKEDLKEMSPHSPTTIRRKAMSSLTQVSPNQNNIIQEDSGESDSHQSNHRISIESKNEELLKTPPSLIDHKKIKFLEQDYILQTSHSSSGNDNYRNSSSFESILNTSKDQFEPKMMLTNKTIKQSKFSKGKTRRRGSAINFGQSQKLKRNKRYEDISEVLNQEIPSKENLINKDEPMAIEHTQTEDQNYRKESISSTKSMISPLTGLKSLQSVHSSSLLSRRSSSNDKRNSQLTFSSQLAQNHSQKKEFPRIAQLRKEMPTQLLNSPKNTNGFNSSSSYYINNNNQLTPSLCSQCQCQIESYQTPKNHFKLSGDNMSNNNKNDNLLLQYGSLLVTRPKGNSVHTPIQQHNLTHQNSNTSLNYTNSITSNRNSIMFPSHLNSRRNSHNRGVNGIQTPQDQLSIYQQAMLLRALKHKDSFSSSNSPRSRRYLSVSSNKYNRIEVAYNTDQILKKVNSIYDKLYTESSQKNENFSLEFDKQKDYEIYFPKFNLSQVLKRQKDKKKTNQINRFIQAFNISRGTSHLEENDRSRTLTIGTNKLISRSVSATYNENNRKISVLNPSSPVRNRSARSSIFIPQNGQVGNPIKGLKLRPSLNSEGQWEIKSATYPKKNYF